MNSHQAEILARVRINKINHIREVLESLGFQDVQVTERVLYTVHTEARFDAGSVDVKTPVVNQVRVSLLSEHAHKYESMHPSVFEYFKTSDQEIVADIARKMGVLARRDADGTWIKRESHITVEKGKLHAELRDIPATPDRVHNDAPDPGPGRDLRGIGD